MNTSYYWEFEEASSVEVNEEMWELVFGKNLSALRSELRFLAGTISLWEEIVPQTPTQNFIHARGWEFAAFGKLEQGYIINEDLWEYARCTLEGFRAPSGTAGMETLDEARKAQKKIEEGGEAGHLVPKMFVLEPFWKVGSVPRIANPCGPES